MAATCSWPPAINMAGWSAHRRPRIRQDRTGTFVRFGSKHCRTDHVKTRFRPYWDVFSARFGAVSGVLLGLAQSDRHADRGQLSQTPSIASVPRLSGMARRTFTGPDNLTNVWHKPEPWMHPDGCYLRSTR